MSQWSDASGGGRPSMEELSALADGELDAAGVARACVQWRDDADSRASWHAYQLIGDALRSEDLCTSAHRDGDFLAALRQRLAHEPVVLAPMSAVSEPPADVFRAPALVVRRRSWATPAAVAAGFVVVAGALVAVQMGGLTPNPVQPGGVVAQKDTVPAVVPVVAEAGTGAASATGGSSVVLSGDYYRDARMEEYFAAHKRFGGSSAPGGPSGVLQKAALETSGR